MKDIKGINDSIINQKAPIISLADGLVAVRLIDQVLESARTNKEVKL